MAERAANVDRPAWSIVDETTPLDAALQIARCSLRVVPLHAPTVAGGCTCRRPNCSARGKHPILPAWQKRATSDELELRDQFSRFAHDVNIGIALGEQPNGLYVVAIDVDDADRRAALETELGPLPPTLAGRSARGERLFYRLPSDAPLERVSNVTGLGGAKGVDLKARGGQVVVGPSLHESGVRYSWTYPLADIAELPSTWLLSLLQAPPRPKWAAEYTPQTMREDARARKRADKYLQSAVIAEARFLARAGEGVRNTTLHTSLCRLLPLAHGLSLIDGHGYVVRELSAAARAAGLDDREVSPTVASAERWLRETGAVRVLPHEPAASPAPQPEALEPRSPIALIEDNGSPAKIAENVARMLAIYPKGAPRLDTFANRICWTDGSAVTDADELSLQGWLMTQPSSSRVRASVETVHGGLLLAANARPFHPVREYLASLEWDRSNRIDAFWTTYFGAVATPYLRGAARCFLIGAVARVMVPGCQLDTMPVLESPQGKRKSTALRVLAGDSWFSDARIPSTEPNMYQVLSGVWLYEMSELASLKGRDVEATKAYVTSRVDHFRPSYGRHVVDRPRQVAFIGSTNAGSYLHDDTGNRRYHPIRCETIDVEALRRDRDQLWAEALQRYQAGEPWWLEGALADDQAEEVELRRHEDPWEAAVRGLQTSGPETISKILADLGVELGKQTRADEMRLSSLLKREGWERKRTMRLGRQHSEWERSAR